MVVSGWEWGVLTWAQECQVCRRAECEPYDSLSISLPDPAALSEGSCFYSIVLMYLHWNGDILLNFILFLFFKKQC